MTANPTTNDWTCALALDERQNLTSGSAEGLAEAVRRGADIRLYTTFDWAEHMGDEADTGLVEETLDLRVVYLLGDRWVAALTALRHPAEGGLGFPDESSLSLFMYNQDGQFGIARPYLRSLAERSAGGANPNVIPSHTSHYHLIDAADQETNSPSHNAVYDFGCFRWMVRDDWTQVLEHDEAGEVVDGSLTALRDAFREGRSVKVVIRDLCRRLGRPGEPALEHEVAVELGSMYFHHTSGFHSGESLPLVEIAPDIPLAYRSGGWAFGWVLPRTDGRVFHLTIDPYTRQPTRVETRHAIRWLVR